MKKIEIYVVSHKEIDQNKYPERKIIYVGPNCNNFSIDNKTTFSSSTKNNINDLNWLYCELTAMYWVWKNNLKTDYVGFEHYRRNLKHGTKIASKEWILKKLMKYDFVHYRTTMHLCKVGEYWKKFEGKYLYTILENAIKKVEPKYYQTWIERMNSKFEISCNIFMCSWDKFDKYMTFIFNILEEARKNLTHLTHEQQSRSLGFMSERLFYTFLKYNYYSHISMQAPTNKKI